MAVGQLTLDWEVKSHKTTVQEVRKDIHTLEGKKIAVKVSWSSGHADI